MSWQENLGTALILAGLSTFVLAPMGLVYWLLFGN